LSGTLCQFFQSLICKLVYGSNKPWKYDYNHLIFFTFNECEGILPSDKHFDFLSDLINVSIDRLDYGAIHFECSLKVIPPNRFLGTVYEGNFDDGLFHGDGTMYYSSGSRIEGVWEKGKCVQQDYIFSDGLRFQQNIWQYCKVPDRRYYSCQQYSH